MKMKTLYKDNPSAWTHSVNFYAKWAKLGTEGAKEMMLMHRARFPTMGKVFDEIDSEIKIENERKRK